MPGIEQMKLGSTEVEIQADLKVIDRGKNVGFMIMFNNNFFYIPLMYMDWRGMGFLAEERKLY